MSDEKPEQSPDLPQPRPAEPVLPGGSYYERLAAPLPEATQPRVPVPDGYEAVTETMAQRDARRLRFMLGENYRPESGADLTFDPRIAYTLALEMDTPANVFAKYGVSLERAREMIKSRPFIDTLRRYKEEVHESGITFKLKAKIQAEDLLTHSYHLAVDPEVPAAVRADLIKWTAKMAGLEPSDKKGMGEAGGPGFTLNLTFAASTPGRPEPRVVSGEIIEEDKP